MPGRDEEAAANSGGRRRSIGRWRRYRRNLFYSAVSLTFVALLLAIAYLMLKINEKDVD